MEQNAVCFRSVADSGRRPKNRVPESKNASKDAGVPGLKTHYYPANTIRRGRLFVKEKLERSGEGGAMERRGTWGCSYAPRNAPRANFFSARGTGPASNFVMSVWFLKKLL